MAHLRKGKSIRWLAPVALVGAVGFGACGNGSDSEDSVRTYSPQSAAYGSDVHLGNLAADIGARSAAVSGNDVHLANMATDPALRIDAVSGSSSSTAAAEAAERDAHLQGNATTYGQDGSDDGSEDTGDDEFVPGSRRMPVR